MNGNPKLGIVVSHPIQYYSPLFKYLAKHINLVVFYCHNPTDEEIGRAGFGIKFKWDVDLLSEHTFAFLKNISSNPDVSRFSGCDTPDIGEQFKEHKISHVLIMGWYLKSYWQAYWFCIRNKIPVAVRGDSQINPDENKIKAVLKKLLYPLFIKKYDALLYVGERNKQYLLKHGARPEQLLFSPHAVDQSFWKAENVERSAKENKIVFVWAAKFIFKKQPLEVIKAFIKAHQQNPNIELRMIGTGELLQESMRAASEISFIKFEGFKNQTALRDIFSQTHALIITSTYAETWGLVVNEALSMHLPVIVSDACGCAPDMVDDGANGFVYKHGNVDDLADKILQTCNLINSDYKNMITAINRKNEKYSYSENLQALTRFINL
ncbi:MAG: glycosyltransferase family 4 protein [Bacteroidia bacterium]|nr:glycosyltransferase family 4 protein [Bacteroidia bacterium]